MRKVLAEYWFGKQFPRWSKPAEITIEVYELRKGIFNSGGGATSFAKYGGHVDQWSGKWVGPPGKLIIDVVPHEVSHMVWATEMRSYPGHLPRWLDEGIASLAESFSEQRRHWSVAKRVKAKLGWLFATEQEYQNIGTQYALGHSFVRYVHDKHGKSAVVEMAHAVLSKSSVPTSLGYRSHDELERRWVAAKPSLFNTLFPCWKSNRGRRPSVPPSPAKPPAPPLRGPKGEQGPKGDQGGRGNDGESFDPAALLALSNDLKTEIGKLRAELDDLKNAELLIGFIGTDGKTSVVERKKLFEIRAAPGGGYFFDLSKLVNASAE